MTLLMDLITYKIYIVFTGKGIVDTDIVNDISFTFQSVITLVVIRFFMPP